MRNSLARGRKSLFDDEPGIRGVDGTFYPNYGASVHRWYPYIEGFSADYAQHLIDEFAHPGCRVYDPFAGTGTTVTVAAANRLLPFYSEINPFLRLVVEAKTNVLRDVARRTGDLGAYFDGVEKSAAAALPAEDGALDELRAAFSDRPYFRGRRLVEIVALKRAFARCPAPALAFAELAKLALAAIAVSCSEMKRAADLRYRTDRERLADGLSPLSEYHKKVRQIRCDIDPRMAELPSVTCLSESALTEPASRDYLDLVITSPPYLNGTNYFRNTKLELWLTGLLRNESELAGFYDAALAAGINSISRRGRPPARIAAVETVATRLDEIAYDRRIPELVRRYFSDTRLWVENVHTLLRPGGVLVVDIGDSRFAGVHVPVDELLAGIAQACGFHRTDTRVVRKRTSKDGGVLKQVLLIFEKPRGRGSGGPGRGRRGRRDDYRSAAVEFGRTLPHLEAPYASRNWGHGLHSLCSYQGKLKPAIAHFLVERFSAPGDRVLDPLAGCGTIPLEAFLQGRVPLGNDLQELAYILTRAKLERGPVDEVARARDELLSYVERHKGDQDPAAYADFGFNGRVPDYFHADTYREVLAARGYLKSHPCDSWGRAVVYAALLHVLHGNRPYALSRRSHPVTPFKPLGPAEYRSQARRLTEKVARTVSERLPAGTVNGAATLGPFTGLPYRHGVDVVITSPPFAASTRFFSSNWMRLWMAGWEPADFSARRAEFLEHRQARSLDVYRTFFECAGRWLRPGGRLILHAGRTKACDMAAELVRRATDQFELVYSFDEDVAGREKFGVRDQGATVAHQYLFFRRNEGQLVR
jgi:DNA modification methylase